MKERLVLICLLACYNFCSAQKLLTLTNPINMYRSDELIVMKRSEMVKLISTGKPYMKVMKEGKELQVQFDDLDNDEKWDEAVFLYSFAPFEKLVLSITATGDKPHSFKQRAHVRQMRKNTDNSFGPNLSSDSIPKGQQNTDFSKVKLPPFLTEGPAWENDKVGFRLYFDLRNGKDIWGKTTPRMMMDSVGVNPSVIYHNRAEWGMDIYKVGSSLSAGALALKIRQPGGKDSLIRLGGINMGRVIYQKIADGPIRAKFKLYYPEWKFAAGYDPLSLSEEISIWGGQYFYQSEIRLLGAPGNSKLVTGFANLYSVPSATLNGKKTAVLYSYGLQSENKDNLGLAIMGSKDEIVSFGESLPNEKDIKDSYLVTLNIPAKNRSTTFRFYAGWSPSDPHFLNKEGFVNFLKGQTEIYEKKILMKWK
jgi:hypothetical protein